jgi:hypothetical protein
MNINYLAVLVAAVAQFIFGAIWYMPIFGKIWGRMHGFDKLPQDVQEQMYKGMWPWLVLQFIVTVVTTLVFALLLNGFPSDWNIYGLAGFFWLGFILPTQISAVVFGGTDPQWIWKKIAISSAASLINMLIIAAILKAFM